MCTFYVQKRAAGQKHLNDVEWNNYNSFFQNSNQRILWNKMKISIGRWSFVITKSLLVTHQAMPWKSGEIPKPLKLNQRGFQTVRSWYDWGVMWYLLLKLWKSVSQRTFCFEQSCLISCYVIPMGEKWNYEFRQIENDDKDCIL